jgi:hypothetical protein
MKKRIVPQVGYLQESTQSILPLVTIAKKHFSYAAGALIPSLPMAPHDNCIVTCLYVLNPDHDQKAGNTAYSNLEQSPPPRPKLYETIRNNFQYLDLTHN